MPTDPTCHAIPSSAEINFLQMLSEEFLTHTWQELQRTRRMTSAFSVPGGGEAMFMATTFSDAFEGALYLQPLDGDTLYEDAAAHQVIYARSRRSTDSAWTAWTCQSRARP